MLVTSKSESDSSFGICFDVDGVIAHGTVAIPAAVEAFRRLTVETDRDIQVDQRQQRRCRIPINFVTNSLNRSADRVGLISKLLGVEVSVDQLIQAPSPLKVFSDLHDKFCLIVGQGMVAEIATDLGFRKFCSMEDIVAAFPHLDPDNDLEIPTVIASEDQKRSLPEVEAIILMGEPKRWEIALQIIIDLLRTNGNTKSFQRDSSQLEMLMKLKNVVTNQLPVIACNMDLQFKDRAPSPRFGHGAFLVCLEELYKKVTGNDLTYTALIGKPSEITYRFAEHVLTSQAMELGEMRPLKTMYFIGDTPEADIAGANIYQRYIDGCQSKIDQCCKTPDSRILPYDGEQKLNAQTVTRIVPILVCTGVYRPPTSPNEDDTTCRCPVYHGHRDFRSDDYADLCRPAALCADVLEAINYILAAEGIDW